MYSRTSSTYSAKDELAAIAAVARRLGQVLSDQYAAGVFLSSDPSILAWYAHEMTSSLTHDDKTIYFPNDHVSSLDN